MTHDENKIACVKNLASERRDARRESPALAEWRAAGERGYSAQRITRTHLRICRIAAIFGEPSRCCCEDSPFRACPRCHPQRVDVFNQSAARGISDRSICGGEL